MHRTLLLLLLLAGMYRYVLLRSGPVSCGRRCEGHLCLPDRRSAGRSAAG